MFNKVILLGNVTRDPEMKQLGAKKTALVELSLAVTERRKDASGNYVDDTTFVTVDLWGRTAEIAAEYLTKGSQVFIEGRLKLDSWEKDGKKNYKLKVVGDQLKMLGAKKSAAPANEYEGTSAAQQRRAKEHAEETGNSESPF